MKPFDLEIIKSFRDKLTELDSYIVVIPHVNPDGDAIGSSLGVANILKNAGKKVFVMVPSHYPDFYKWMSGSDDIVVYSPSRKRDKDLIQNSGMLVCLDFNHISRSGEMKDEIENYKGPKVLIDHHPNPQFSADIMISHPEYSSTAELVFHVMKAVGYEQYVDKNAAECLFCGIMTDTGGFDYNVSDPQTFKTVSELLSFKIDPEEIHGLVFDNYSADRIRLLGYCLSECMEVFPEYHTAVMYLSKEVQKKYNFAPGDSEGFVNYPLSIKGIHFTALFTEKEEHVKASFRSKGEFAVNVFSSKDFNGGGHRNAAGGELKATLDEALLKFKSLLPQYQNELVLTKPDIK